MSKRQGSLIWKGCNVEWWYETFKDPATFEIQPHFKLRVSNVKGEWIEWPNVQIDTDELHNSLKGITDFTELPKELYSSVLDNCVLKFEEEQPQITRIIPDGSQS